LPRPADKDDVAVEYQHCFLGMPAIIASQAMLQVLESARRVARCDVSVLITGETGCGKEIVARAIHHHSLRCSKPWVDINCAALPEQLMESEMFGHEKGAFSGADSARTGFFELAHTGSLFLDEVAELEPRLQVKLLRVLDGAPYYRLGGTRKVMVDVRVIAATNQDLERAIAQGRFRADLYHRLKQYHVHVPPLRERLADIVPLAEYFLQKHSPAARFSEAAKAALRSHLWPGNIRELQNAIVQAAINAREYDIQVEDLPPLERSAPMCASPACGFSLDGLERQTILDALEKTAGHHQKAADLLGISRRTLSRKLKLYRLQSIEELAYS
jgi:DNA-binding NtrC family response regulator